MAKYYVNELIGIKKDDYLDQHQKNMKQIMIHIEDAEAIKYDKLHMYNSEATLPKIKTVKDYWFYIKDEVLSKE